MQQRLYRSLSAKYGTGLDFIYIFLQKVYRCKLYYPRCNLKLRNWSAKLIEFFLFMFLRTK